MAVCGIAANTFSCKIVDPGRNSSLLLKYMVGFANICSHVSISDGQQRPDCTNGHRFNLLPFRAIFIIISKMQDYAAQVALSLQVFCAKRFFFANY